MQVKNPTDKDITVQIEGSVYEVGAGQVIGGVRREHAIHWQTHIHSFLILSEEEVLEADSKPVVEELEEMVAEEEKVEEVAEETADEVAEEVVEEVVEEVEEKPKKKSKAKAKK